MTARKMRRLTRPRAIPYSALVLNVLKAVTMKRSFEYFPEEQ